MKKTLAGLRLGLCLLALSLGCQPSGTEGNSRLNKPDSRPNILLILVDDMGYSDLSCYGSEIQTPHIDSLALGGLRMTQFYNAARCGPSRASLLTGLYPHQAGMGHQNKDWGLPSYRGYIGKNAVTMAEVLQGEGYATYQVGKWHVGNREPHWPGNKGFEQSFTLIEGAMSYYNQWPWVRGQDSLSMTYNGRNYRTDKDFFATDTFSDTAAAFINRHAPDQPFFMYLAYNAPHWPLHAKPEDIALYKGRYAAGWDSIRSQRHQRMLGMGLLPGQSPLSSRFSGVPAWEQLSDSARSAWAAEMELYAAVMHRLDLGVGKVVEALRKSQQLENTLIVFLSDNGACHEDPTGPWSVYPEDGAPGSARSFPAYGMPWANVGNTPFRLFKSWLHEGGIRTPLIVHRPGQIPAGKIDQQTTGHIMDLMPTVLELAGTTYPSQFDKRAITPTPGISLLSAWSGAALPGDRTLFWEHQFNRAVRQGDWKLVSAYQIPGQGKQDQWELYNLREDPIESQNLASQYPARVTNLAAQYATWANEVGAYEKPVLDSLKALP
jgi:arylsulfatase A-like enzyme